MSTGWVEQRHPRRLLGDRSGAVAVEFALLAPALIFILAGSMELAHLMIAERKVLGVAQATADLIGQADSEMSRADIEGVCAGAQMMIYPYEATDLSVTIAHLEFPVDSSLPPARRENDQNCAIVNEEVDLTDGNLPNAVELATGLGEPLSSVVIARADFNYSSVWGTLVLGTDGAQQTITRIAFARPRRTRVIDFTYTP